MHRLHGVHVRITTEDDDRQVFAASGPKDGGIGVQDNRQRSMERSMNAEDSSNEAGCGRWACWAMRRRLRRGLGIGWTMVDAGRCC